MKAHPVLALFVIVWLVLLLLLLSLLFHNKGVWELYFYKISQVILNSNESVKTTHLEPRARLSSQPSTSLS